MNMKKIITIGIITLFVIFSFPISADTTIGEYETYLNIRGWVINPQFENNIIKGQAIRLRYRFLNISGEEARTGVVRFPANVSFDDVFITINIKNLCFVWGLGKSGFTIDNHPL